MNHLTIAFMCRLSEHTQAQTQLLQRMQKELLSEMQKRLPAFLHRVTSFLSSQGNEFSAKLNQWMDDVQHMGSIDVSGKLFRRLQRLCTEADKLAKESRAAWQYPGKLDPDLLHFVFPEQKEEAESRLYSAVCLEMFRLVASGGAERFIHFPKLQYVHPTVRDYYLYYAKHIIPALIVMDRHRRFGIWAFQYKEQARTGGMSRMPVYIQTAPKIERTPLLLGECRSSGAANAAVWQGLGALTNITPENIVRAQSEGIIHSIRPEQLKNLRLNTTPTQILEQCFPGQWYALDPVHFFSVLTTARCARTLMLRINNNQCLYCGTDGANGSLCLGCLG